MLYLILFLFFSFFLSVLLVFFRVCTSIQNDTLGCNTVTWGPFSALGSLSEDGTSTQRLATGSCDNMVRMYKLQNGTWEEEAKESSPHIGMFAFAYSFVVCCLLL
jgi:hypothetical protein